MTDKTTTTDKSASTASSKADRLEQYRVMIHNLQSAALALSELFVEAPGRSGRISIDGPTAARRVNEVQSYAREASDVLTSMLAVFGDMAEMADVEPPKRVGLKVIGRVPRLTPEEITAHLAYSHARNKPGPTAPDVSELAETPENEQRRKTTITLLTELTRLSERLKDAPDPSQCYSDVRNKCAAIMEIAGASVSICKHAARPLLSDAPEPAKAQKLEDSPLILTNKHTQLAAEGKRLRKAVERIARLLESKFSRPCGLTGPR